MASSNSQITVPPLAPGSLTCLAGKSVYLDISSGDPGRPLIKFIRKHLKKQGAIVDDFFSRSVHYVFTDRSCCTDENVSQQEQDLTVPSVRNYTGQNGVIKAAISMGIGVYRLATIENWLRRNLRLMGCLSSSAGGAASGGGVDFVMAAMSGTSSFHSRPPPGLQLAAPGSKSGVAGGKGQRFSSMVANSRPVSKKPVVEKPPIRLNGAFIRLDDKTGQCRPFFHEMTSWPVLRLDPLSRGASSTAAAGGSPFVDLVTPAQPSIQPGPRLVAIEKRNVAKPSAMRGYCEACCMAVADIDRHLQGDEHAKRIKKAATTTNSGAKQHQVTGATKSGSKPGGSKTGLDDGDNFAKPLATLDAVIGQHFGTTPSMRTALLESYLEQAAGEYLQEQTSCEVVNSSVNQGDDDDDDDGSSDEGDETIPAKKVRNDTENLENIQVKESLSLDQQHVLDAAVLATKLEKLVQEEQIQDKCNMADVPPPIATAAQPTSPDVLADLLDNWGDKQLAVTATNIVEDPSPQITKQLDSLSMAPIPLQLPAEANLPIPLPSNEQGPKRTRRLLPTIGATAEALAQSLQQSFSSSLFGLDDKEEAIAQPEKPQSFSASSSLPFPLSPRKQLQEAMAAEKAPSPKTKPKRAAKSKKTQEEKVPPVRKPRAKKKKEDSVRSPSPVIPSRSAPRQMLSPILPRPVLQQPQPQSFTIPCSTQVGYLVQQQHPQQAMLLPFPAAIASFLQQQQQQFQQPTSIPRQPLPPFAFVLSPQPQVLHQQQQPYPFAMMTTRRQNGNNNNSWDNK